MPRRLLTLLALPALALVAGAGCADEVSPAVRIGDVKVSDSDLLDEVDEWAHNEQANVVDLVALNPGTYPMQLVDAILQQRIDLELHAEKFEELGLELTDDMRRQALDIIFQGDLDAAERALGGFSDEYAEDYVDAVSRQFAVEAELGQVAYGEWLNATYLEADIEVSPRYGRWDPDQQGVVGPDGPIQPGLETDEL